MNQQTIIQNESVKKTKNKGKGCLISFVILFFIVSIILGLLNSFGKLEPSTETEEDSFQEKSGEDYETAVWQSFWESASDYFGVEYSDYKMADTAYSYISESITTDGNISYYYLIQTAYETQNIYGATSLHKVTARCYYVPDTNVVYTTYMTCDGERVYYDGEKEAWLLGMES